MHDAVLTSVMKSYIFQVSLIVFKDFSRLFHTSDYFPDFSRPGKFQLKITYCTYSWRDGEAELARVIGLNSVMVHPKTVTDLSTNWVRHRVTSLMCTMPLPLSQTNRPIAGN